MQSGIFFLRYSTELTDAGMPMLGLVLRMPMPTNDFEQALKQFWPTKSSEETLAKILSSFSIGKKISFS
jgi:hypothetical protein